MTRTLQWLAAFCLAALSTSAMAGSTSPVGSWQVTTGDARYNVVACGKNDALLCAKLVWLAPGKRTEENLALLNTYVVEGAIPNGANKWSGSVVLDGRAYDGTVTMVSKNFLTLRGCAGFLCQTYEFTRI